MNVFITIEEFDDYVLLTKRVGDFEKSKKVAAEIIQKNNEENLEITKKIRKLLAI